MPTDVIMPQMGESIFEGTITKWLKQPGERVERDQPLFEISTDKVDAEIPAPAGGVLKEIKAQAGATVQVNSVVAVIDDAGAAVSVVQPPAAHETGPAQASSPSATTHPLQSATLQAGPTTDVVMPQMGESIFEGTITRWLKNVGDRVTRDEPLFEISTDKVDAEIPAPAGGVLKEIKAQAGATVQVNSVLAVIAAEGAPAAAQPLADPVGTPAEPAKTATAGMKAAAPAEALSAEETERIRSSPLVRRLAQEHGVDLRQVTGTGSGGRITKEEDGYAVSNGLAWSPDGRIMYHSDSTGGIIEAWDFDPATGGRTNHRIVAKLTNEDGRPDGAATDAQGNYWSAGPSAGCINCFNPAGKLLRKWAFPVPGPTMPCFADGALYVTSLREGKSAAVLADFPTLGGLFRADAPAIGAPVGLFAD